MTAYLSKAELEQRVTALEAMFVALFRKLQGDAPRAATIVLTKAELRSARGQFVCVEAKAFEGDEGRFVLTVVDASEIACEHPLERWQSAVSMGYVQCDCGYWRHVSESQWYPRVDGRVGIKPGQVVPADAAAMQPGEERWSDDGRMGMRAIPTCVDPACSVAAVHPAHDEPLSARVDTEVEHG